MSEVALHTLGTLALRSTSEDDGVLSRNCVGLAVLAYLSETPDHRSQRRHLAQLFWPHADSGRGRRLLRQSLYYVTKDLPAPITRRTEETLALAVDRCAVDVLEFRDRLRSSAYSEALDLYRGRFLTSFPVGNRTELGHWLDARQEQIDRELHRAYRRVIRSRFSRGEYEEGAERAREYVRRNPTDHETHGQIIGHLRSSGHEAESYALYEEYRMALLERGAEPPSEIIQLVANGTGPSPSETLPISGADPSEYV